MDANKLQPQSVNNLTDIAPKIYAYSKELKRPSAKIKKLLLQYNDINCEGNYCSLLLVCNEMFNADLLEFKNESVCDIFALLGLRPCYLFMFLIYRFQKKVIRFDSFRIYCPTQKPIVACGKAKLKFL